MTTSGSDQHIKSIIASHDYRDYAKNDAVCSGVDVASSTENSPARRAPKSTSSSFKRVSFGNSKGTVVQTYIYESVPSVEAYSEQASHSAQALAQISESPSKVKVTTLESEAPHSIFPPAALETSGGDTGTLTAERRVQIISPPLPSLRKMEVENPFRPDGELSHEVDPIVETYKHRPFPSGHRDSVDGFLPPSSPPTSPAKSAPSKNGVKRQEGNRVPAEATSRTNAAQLEVQHKRVASAKPGHLELVHIEPKKRKCGCCSIQ